MEAYVQSAVLYDAFAWPLCQVRVQTQQDVDILGFRHRVIQGLGFRMQTFCLLLYFQGLGCRHIRVQTQSGLVHIRTYQGSYQDILGFILGHIRVHIRTYQGSYQDILGFRHRVVQFSRPPPVQDIICMYIYVYICICVHICIQIKTIHSTRHMCIDQSSSYIVYIICVFMHMYRYI